MPSTTAVTSKALPTAAQIGALVALINQQRPGEAEQRVRSMLAAHPEAAMLWKILGVALLRQGKDALPALRKTSALLPQDAEAHANLGAALHDLGMWAEALTSLGRALEIQPRAVEAVVDAANCLKALGRAREAIPVYQKALALNPTLTEAHNNLGNAFLEVGQFENAAGSYRHALRLAPQDATIHCNLGNALRQWGRLDEAIVSSQRALALDPASSVAHNNLGLIYATQLRREEAEASLRQALRLNPTYVDALNNLGHVLRDAGEPREALSLYAQAVQIDPRRAESHCNIGEILFDQRRTQEAANAYAQALTLRSDYAPAHLGLARILRLRNRADDAERSCRAALAVDANDVRALCLLGELHADRGRFSEAEESFRRAIGIEPEFSAAWCGIAAHRKMSAGDHAWRRSVEALLTQRLPLAQSINLHYALGKYFDDVGQYDAAFDQYHRANESSKRLAPPYDADKLTRRVDAIIGTFDAEFMQRASDHPMVPEAKGYEKKLDLVGVGYRGGIPSVAGNHSPLGHGRVDHPGWSETPVFIVGMPRSGTTLTEQILASHPAVFGAGELLFWEGAFGAYEKTGLGSDAGANVIVGLAADYLARLPAAAAGAQRVTDKMPANFLYVGLIHAAFPKARIIHVRRNPLDTCLSIYFQNFFSMGPYANDLDHLAHYYGEYLRVTRHWRAVVPAHAFLDVPYEGLIEDQEGWTRRLLDFVGLPWDPACLEFHLTERVVVTTSKWQVRQRIHASSVERWRHYEKFLGPLLRLVDHAGYP